MAAYLAIVNTSISSNSHFPYSNGVDTLTSIELMPALVVRIKLGVGEGEGSFETFGQGIAFEREDVERMSQPDGDEMIGRFSNFSQKDLSGQVIARYLNLMHGHPISRLNLASAKVCASLLGLGL